METRHRRARRRGARASSTRRRLRPFRSSLIRCPDCRPAVLATPPKHHLLLLLSACEVEQCTIDSNGTVLMAPHR